MQSGKSWDRDRVCVPPLPVSTCSCLAKAVVLSPPDADLDRKGTLTFRRTSQSRLCSSQCAGTHPGDPKCARRGQSISRQECLFPSGSAEPLSARGRRRPSFIADHIRGEQVPLCRGLGEGLCHPLTPPMSRPGRFVDAACPAAAAIGVALEGWADR